MKIAVSILLHIFFSTCNNQPAKINTGSEKTRINPADTIPAAAAKLIRNYPDFVIGFSNNHLLFADHTELLWDDGIKNKSSNDLLEKPDLKDMFLQQYVKGTLKTAPAKDHDPGRIRNEQFFMKLYGASAVAVKKNLTTITWCPTLVGQKIMVTKINGVDKKLMQISKELDIHPNGRTISSISVERLPGGIFTEQTDIACTVLE